MGEGVSKCLLIFSEKTRIIAPICGVRDVLFCYCKVHDVYFTRQTIFGR